MILFVNVQTTGLEDRDRVCSIGVVSEDDKFYEIVNEGKKIPPSASSINHITNEMLKGKAKLKDTQVYEFLQKHNSASTIFVGHNVGFILEMLHKSGFSFEGKVIDTLRVTKHLIPECEVFSLQYLRYELKLYKQENRTLIAHNALDDAEVVKNLYEYLLDYASTDEMIKLSAKNVLIQKFKYGKYANQYIEEIALSDRGYLEWMLENVLDLDEDLRYSITYFLQGVS